MNLLGTLGLGAVDKPGTIPDGKYNAKIESSAYVHHKAKGADSDAPKDHISHVITYKIVDGDSKGLEKQEWYPICKVEQFAEDGKTPAVIDGRPAVTPTMTEKVKPWYKDRLMSLGVKENEIDTLDPKALEGLPVIMGIKKKDGYVNISFIELNVAPETSAPTSILGSL